MTRTNFLRISSIVTIGFLVLAGCRSEEQGRVVNYEPGVYKGKPDTELSADQKRALRKRSMHPGVGDGGDVSKPALLPPSAASQIPTPEVQVDRAKHRALLNSRTRFQKDSGL